MLIFFSVGHRFYQDLWFNKSFQYLFQSPQTDVFFWIFEHVYTIHLESIYFVYIFLYISKVTITRLIRMSTFKTFVVNCLYSRYVPYSTDFNFEVLTSTGVRPCSQMFDPFMKVIEHKLLQTGCNL